MFLLKHTKKSVSFILIFKTENSSQHQNLRMYRLLKKYDSTISPIIQRMLKVFQPIEKLQECVRIEIEWESKI